MNYMTKSFVFGAIGFILGGIFGGGIIGNMVTNEFKDRIENLEFQNDRLSEEINSLRDERNKAREAQINAEQKVIDTIKEHNEEKKAEELRKTYSCFDEEEDVFDIPDLSYYISEDDNSNYKIRMIDEKTYNEDLNYRDSDTLTYYQSDGILIDSKGKIISNEKDVVGTDIMDIIDDTNNDYLYVLDDANDMLYQINIEHSASYDRDIASGHI